VQILAGLGILPAGLWFWRHGQRYMTWWVRRLWWPGVDWHARNLTKGWYRLMLRGLAVWFVVGGVSLVAAGIVNAARA
jgi:hypothetical protein